MTDPLTNWGWSPDRASTIDETLSGQREGLIPGRIVREDRGSYRVETSLGRKVCGLTGSFRHGLTRRSDFPAVGDWVLCSLEGETGLIKEILPRRGILSRKVPGEETEEQILGSNIDKVLVVYALDGGRSFSARGVERYLTLVWEGGAQPLLVLNKLDLCTDLVPFLTAAEEAAPGVPLFLLSATEGEGVESLRSALKPGETVVLIGPSGVGKSSIINALGQKELQKTGERREEDRRGRHTTTHRELFRLPSGLLLLDSPGLREMQLWGSGENAGRVFPEVEILAEQCRFTDCTHTAEPGCKVREALEKGTLAEERFDSYQELQRELAYLNRRENDKAAREEKNRWKKISQFAKELNKDRKRRYN